jgi:hypothetical protein
MISTTGPTQPKARRLFDRLAYALKGILTLVLIHGS